MLPPKEHPLDIGIKLYDEKMDEEIKKAQNTLIYFRQTVNIAESIINLFALATAIFMFGWIKTNFGKLVSENHLEFFCHVYILISGILLYIFGFIDWYRGNGKMCTVNFLFGLLFTNFFYYWHNKENIEPKIDSKSQGTFYILVAVTVLILLFSCLNKGAIMLLADLAVCLLGLIFLICEKFIGSDSFVKEVAGYLAIIDGGLFWITGLIKIFNFMVNKPIIPIASSF